MTKINYHFLKKNLRLYMAFMYVTYISLLVGGLMGLLQTLVRSGKYKLPFNIDYYTILNCTRRHSWACPDYIFHYRIPILTNGENSWNF